MVASNPPVLVLVRHLRLATSYCCSGGMAAAAAWPLGQQRRHGSGVPLPFATLGGTRFVGVWSAIWEPADALQGSLAPEDQTSRSSCAEPARESVETGGGSSPRCKARALSPSAAARPAAGGVEGAPTRCRRRSTKCAAPPPAPPRRACRSSASRRRGTAQPGELVREAARRAAGLGQRGGARTRRCLRRGRACLVRACRRLRRPPWSPARTPARSPRPRGPSS